MTRRIRVALASTVALALTTLASVTGCALVRPSPADLARVDRDLGMLLLVGFSGTTLDDNQELEHLLCDVRAGSILLFARNITDAAQLRALTTAIHERSTACTGRRALIAVDAEGGRVMRLSPRAGYPETRSAAELGDENDFAQTELEARRIGTMLHDGGIDWDLAPVVDVGYNPANPVIVGHGRSFSGNPRLVTEHARAYVRGMHAAGVLTALKHFPGHGSSMGDSHLGFVDVSDTAHPEIELVPYHALIADRMVDSVMTAHVFNRHVDDRYPATLSRATITGVLRQALAFRGAVVTDDLRMGAIVQHYGLDDAAVLALDAGVDVLLIGDDRLPDGRSASVVALEAIRRALRRGRLTIARVDEALGHVRALAPPRAGS